MPAAINPDHSVSRQVDASLAAIIRLAARREDRSMSETMPAAPFADLVAHEQAVARAALNPDSIAQVLAGLAAVQEVADQMALPYQVDGVACFNRLYTQITQAVADRIQADGFADGTFVEQLDTAFAHRYFEALSLGPHAPLCWSLLLQRRARPDISEIHFAAAGVNAHVNFDLAIALVSACHQHHDDLSAENLRTSYQQVNAIFFENMQSLMNEFDTPHERRIDRGTLAHAADRVGDLTVTLTRDLAWKHARASVVIECRDRDNLQNGARPIHQPCEQGAADADLDMYETLSLLIAIPHQAQSCLTRAPRRRDRHRVPACRRAECCPGRSASSCEVVDTPPGREASETRIRCPHARLLDAVGGRSGTGGADGQIAAQYLAGRYPAASAGASAEQGIAACGVKRLARFASQSVGQHVDVSADDAYVSRLMAAQMLGLC